MSRCVDYETFVRLIAGTTTASGLKVKVKHTIACPPQFPLGTKIKIEGYGTYVCEDRGGAIKGNHVYIYMQTKAEAFAFGRRNLTAEIVN